MDKENNYADFKDIDINTYRWSINVLRSVKKMLKVKIKLHADPQTLNGDIILCNHFSRFETFIPQFLLYEATGAYSCSIASSEFFKKDSLLTKYLNNVGVIPHDHPNLFSSLARQIFLGRKVIIFPEGGMVKDHSYIDNLGNYSIYSGISKTRRKQHTGAAVLAHGIEIFKAAIRNAYGNKNYAQLMQWKQDLRFNSLDQLLTAALKPTLIVPTNITFYPIRSSDNLLLKAVELFADGLSKKQTEELLVEGNILLKNTDMDLRMGAPIDPYEVWHWWDKYLLNLVSSTFKSLDEIFALYSNPKDHKQKLLNYYLKKHSKTTRNQYMKEIYTHVTINLSHLASAFIIYCLHNGLQKIDKHCFYTTLYIAIKKLQNIANINLHRSLLHPDEYIGLISDKNKRFEQFILSAQSAGLITVNENTFQFSPKIGEDYDFDIVRMENLIVVYDNEVKSIKPILDTLIQAYKLYFDISQEQLAQWQFNDEICALKWDKQQYSVPCYDDINSQQTFSENPEPFLLQPKKSNGIGILLIHGLLASPAEVRDFAEFLVKQNYTIFAVRIKGHGTSPYDLRKQTFMDWSKSVKRGFEILNVYCNKMMVVGFSTGGALALKLAAENHDKIIAVVALTVPVKFVNKSFLFVPLLHGTNRLVKWVSSIEGIKPFLENNPEHKNINYSSVPVKSLYELRLLMEDIEPQLEKIKIPTLLVYASEDPIVNPESAEIILAKLTDIHKELVIVNSTRHGILMDNIDDTWTVINNFLKRYI